MTDFFQPVQQGRTLEQVQISTLQHFSTAMFHANGCAADNEPDFSKAYLIDQTARLTQASCSSVPDGGKGCSVITMINYIRGNQSPLPSARHGYAFYPALHRYQVGVCVFPLFLL